MIAYYQKCPICEGKCIVPAGFYLNPYYSYETSMMVSDLTPEECRQCKGKGMILAPMPVLDKLTEPAKEESND